MSRLPLERSTRVRLRLPLLAAILSLAVPVTVQPTGGVSIATLECQTGTCCPQKGATCVISEEKVEGYYAKTTPGSCGSNPTQAAPPP